MTKIKPLQSLKRKLTMVFYLIFMMTLGIGLIAVSLSQSLTMRVDNIISDDLEQVRHSIRLMRGSEQLQTTVARLQGQHTEAERLALLAELDAQWQQLLQGSKQLLSLQPKTPESEALTQDVAAQEKLHATLPYVDELTGQALWSRQQQENVIYNLTTLHSAFVREYRQVLNGLDTEAQHALKHNDQQALTTILERHRNSATLLHLGEQFFTALQGTTGRLSPKEINNQQRHAMRLLLQMESLFTAEPPQALTSNWLSQLRHLIVGEDNLFELNRHFQKRQNIAFTHLQAHALQAQKSAELFAQVLKRKDNDIQQAGTELKTDALAFLILIIVAGVLYCGFIWLTNWHFIAKGIIRPVIATRNAMNDIVNEKLDTELPKADNLELQQMMTSLETLKSYAAQVKAISEMDGLTGIHNRRHFDLQLSHALKHAQQIHQPLGMLLIDLDFFKLYNDNYGHVAGDNCLKQVVQEIRAALPGRGETFARFGGEEFVILLPGYNQAKLKTLAETLCHAVAAAKLPHRHSHHGVVTLSVGGSVLPPDQPGSANELTADTDKALYQAKQHGKNCAVIRVMEPEPV